jgi:DSF synthase
MAQNQVVGTYSIFSLFLDIMTATVPSSFCPLTELGTTTQTKSYYEPGRKAVWLFMNASPRPSFNPELLAEVDALFHFIQQNSADVDFFVSGSSIPGMYNAGGDLKLFANAIRSRDSEALLRYAQRCVEIVDLLYNGFHKNIVTLAMVEGSALGGGFEAALAHQFVLASTDAKLGYPEIAFNLFPGMGAYSVTARKANARVAEHLISTGISYPADWHFEKGLVDELFAPGNAMQAVRTKIDILIPRLNGIRAMLRARQRIAAVTLDELSAITQDWVSSALSIEDKDLAYMDRLVMLQNRRAAPASRPLANLSALPRLSEGG